MVPWGQISVGILWKIFPTSYNAAGQMENFYIKNNFEVYPYLSNSLQCGNILARLCNGFVRAIHDRIKLPKYLVITIDADIINSAQIIDYSISKIYGERINWLALEIFRLIQLHLDRLPRKAKKSNYPSIIWINPPIHKNFGDNNVLRKKFASSLDNILSVQHQCLRIS